MAATYTHYMPKPEASINITANNTYDILDYATAVVNVPNPSTGKIEITTTESVNTTPYATAQVVDADITASNIRENKTILGVTGTTECITEATSLPTTDVGRIVRYDNNLYGKYYTITTNLTGCSGRSSNKYYIAPGGTNALVFTVDSDYDFPSAITVTGATYTWDQNTGTLVLSNPTSDVSISIICHVTDLTGTTWLLNLDAEAGTSTVYSITYWVASSTNTVSEFYVPFTWNETFNIYYYFWNNNSTLPVYFGVTDDRTSYALVFAGMFTTDSRYQTIHITGGTDATNTTLINWLYNNATLQS